MVNLITTYNLLGCIKNVRDAGDSNRSILGYSEASILVIFINNYDKNESYILLTQRKNNLRKHAGQIAFPGGRKEIEDKTLLETVVRETEEEISLSRENYDIIGHFPKFYTGTGYVVTPYIALMKELSNWENLIKPNADEVKKIFIPKSQQLLLPEYHIREKPPIKSSMSMTWRINYQNENIWGLTARVLVTLSAGLGLREYPPCDDI
ncbi:CoA pyrophosphatase [Alphaproteobacteria bacterium]|jgi:8-oxo-dGTP pyrophosphatase MutT (NUDIX family)|nr:CoA pyrophosphatase [Alphaproteobacteria bacterium]MDG1465767.1 CoA pyrophosphatase [Alphaproteobacteria bacterium]|tara:strand:+ start:182 stop:805 length:624 start_codon:yes stop_codon:yes gene_type:complete